MNGSGGFWATSLPTARLPDSTGRHRTAKSSWEAPCSATNGGRFSLHMGSSVTFVMFFAAPCPQFWRGWGLGDVGWGANFMVCSLKQRRFHVKEKQLRASSAKGDRPVWRGQSVGCDSTLCARCPTSCGWTARAAFGRRRCQSRDRQIKLKATKTRSQPAAAPPWGNMTRTARGAAEAFNRDNRFSPIRSIGGKHLTIVSKI